MEEVKSDLGSGMASNTQAPVVTRSTSTLPVLPLTEDFNPTIEEEADSAPITEAANPIPSTGAHQTPVTESDPPPTTEQDPTPAPGDTLIPMDEASTMRPGSVPLTSDSELTQLSDSDTP